eukprot:TRINITY_DN3969_c0_g7_i1.p1 TRINITY_DN3969_c0_g7~~TRINITY_DN3969_c0_g7_i1.p1  ORF type:complete len:521 (+),score=220.56 TRINITY_DN3969_c0_g7_i1:119-1564(+)
MSASLTAVMMPKRPAIMHAGRDFVNSHLARQASVNTKSLSNGLKVATEKRSSAAAAVGLYARCGSRFETVETNGAAHLMQRAMLHGTASKSREQIQAALAAIGGRLVTSTDREMQGLKIVCDKSDVGAAIDLLADIAQNPRLDDAAVTAARGECIDAMKDWEDNLPTQVLSNMHRSCYDTTDGTAGQGLGLAPLGSGANIKGGLLAEDVRAFHKAYYANASQLSLVVSGDVDEAQVGDKAEAALGSMATGPPPAIGKRYVGGHVKISQGAPKPPYASHLAVGWEICGADCADVVPLQLLLEVFGSYDRFQHDLCSNWSIRGVYERQQEQLGKGSLHEVQPFLYNYSDTGLMGIYLVHNHGADREEQFFFIQRCLTEWCKYCMRLENYQVEVGKNKLKSKLLFARDGASKSCDVIGKELTTVGRSVPLAEMFQRIDELDTTTVSDVINHYYYDRECVMSAWGVYYLLPEYFYVRRSMFKWRY